MVKPLHRKALEGARFFPNLSACLKIPMRNTELKSSVNPQPGWLRYPVAPASSLRVRAASCRPFNIFRPALDPI